MGWAAAVALAAFLFALADAGGFSVNETTVIAAPREEVWPVLFSMAEWATWNEVFAIQIDGPPEVGKPLRITSHWEDGTTSVSNEKIVTVEYPSRMCWEYQDLPQWLLGTDRCISLAEAQDFDGKPITHLANYEVFDGPVSTFVKWYKGYLIEDGFRKFNRALKTKISGKPRPAWVDIGGAVA
mmetsp:Transcript_8558/g.16204  ORF Transcript_8558/g.16204 Transcript_8558/m.16204 type:complete len:183 (-) Transcript_8558:186-734(-)